MKAVMLGFAPSVVYLSAFVTTALCLLQPTHTEGRDRDVPFPFGGDMPETEAATTPAGVNTTATTTAAEQEAGQHRGFGLPCARDRDCMESRGLSCQGWLCACGPESPVRVRDDGADTCLPAKSLYESCRHHEECSHRSANMRCVDFLCYCPLPFELRGSGDCLEPQQSLAKLIAAVTPATILLVTTLAIGVAFIFRRLFSGSKTADDVDDPRRPWQHPNAPYGSVRARTATAAISIRTRPRTGPRPYGRRRTSSQSSGDRTGAPPLPRLVRWPPDRALKANSFSPELMGTTAAMRSSATTPPGAGKQSPLRSPQPLSTSLLVEKLFSLSMDSFKDEGIVIRVQREDKAAPMAALSKTPLGRQGSLIPPPSSRPREISRTRTPDHNSEELRSSLPNAWRTSATGRGNVLATSALLPFSPNSGRHDVMHPEDQGGKQSGPTQLSSSRRQSKGVTFADVASQTTLVPKNYERQGGEPSGPFPAPAETDDSSHVEPGGLELDSLNAKTRWLSQSARPVSAQDHDAASGRRAQWSSAPPLVAAKDLQASGSVCHDAPRSRDPTVSGRSPALGECNRLGVAAPFVDEGPLSESASVALSFLSSSSSTDELVPRPDIESAVLRAAESRQGEGANARTEDTRLVDQFMAAALDDTSSSDVAPSALPFSSAAQAGLNEAQVARMVKARRGYNGMPGPPTPTPKHLFPILITAVRDKGAAASNSAPEKGKGQTTVSMDRHNPTSRALTADAQAESTSSSTDIENLSEILTSIKVTQLGNQHHQRERTLLREYAAGATPAVPLATPDSVASLSRALRLGLCVVATSAALMSPEAEHSAQVSATAAPVPPSTAATEAARLPAESMLLPLTEFSEFTGEVSVREELSGVRRPPSKSEPSVAAQTVSRDAGEVSSSPCDHRRWASVAELHRARTANSRLVPPAALPFRPTPMKRSIRYRRTTSSQLQVISEALHGVEMSCPPVPLRTKVPFKGEGEAFCDSSIAKVNAVSQLQDDAGLDGQHRDAKRFASVEGQKDRANSSGEHSSTKLVAAAVLSTDRCSTTTCREPSRPLPAHVPSEPLRLRSPFAVRKHLSEPLQGRSAACTLRAVQSTEAVSVASCSSSPAVGSIYGANDTEEVIPSPVSTVIASTGMEDEDEGELRSADLPSEYCRPHFWSVIAASMARPPCAEKCDADSASVKGDATPSPVVGEMSLAVTYSEASTGATLGTLSKQDLKMDLSDFEASAVTGQSPLHPADRGESEIQMSAAKRPIPPPRKARNILFTGSIISEGAPSIPPVPWPRSGISDKVYNLERQILVITGTTEFGVPRVESASNGTGALCLEDLDCCYPKQPSDIAKVKGPSVKPSVEMSQVTSIRISRSSPLPSASEMSVDGNAPESISHVGRARSLSAGRRDNATRSAENDAGLPSSSRSRTVGLSRTERGTPVTTDLPASCFPLRREHGVSDDVRSEMSEATNSRPPSTFLANLGIFPPEGHGHTPPEIVSDLSVGAGFPVDRGPEDSGSCLGGAEATSLTLFRCSGSCAELHRGWPESSTSFSIVETGTVKSPLEEPYVDNKQTVPARDVSQTCSGNSTSAIRRCDSPRPTPFRGRPLSSTSDFYSCS